MQQGSLFGLNECSRKFQVQLTQFQNVNLIPLTLYEADYISLTSDDLCCCPYVLFMKHLLARVSYSTSFK